jgi:hypothetical protein
VRPLWVFCSFSKKLIHSKGNRILKRLQAARRASRNFVSLLSTILTSKSYFIFTLLHSSSDGGESSCLQDKNPVAFNSRKLKTAQKRNTTTKRDCDMCLELMKPARITEISYKAFISPFMSAHTMK